MLYIVSTPIGNIKDITLRAIEVLRNSDFIFCEDTRRSINLLNYYQIKKPLLRYSDYIDSHSQKIIDLVLEGKKVSLISDSGMPNISDPGIKVIKYAIEKKIKIEVIGGVSAVINAITLSGFDGSSFIFLGFLKRGVLDIIKSLEMAFLLDLPVVLYESPKRLGKFLEILKWHFPDTYVVIAREMTKVYEEWIRGNVVEVFDILKGKEIKGEITIVLKKDRKVENIRSIGFVCDGNSCRSVMAHYYALKVVKEKNLSIGIFSAGINVNENSSVCEYVLRILRENGIEEIKHIPLQLDFKFVEKNDLILTMTKRQKKLLKGFFPQHSHKIYTLLEYAGYRSDDIYDPYGKSYLEYEFIFKIIKNAVDKIVEFLMGKELK